MGRYRPNIATLTVLAWFEEAAAWDTKASKRESIRRMVPTSIDGLDDKPVYIMAIDWQAAKKGNACPPSTIRALFREAMPS